MQNSVWGMMTALALSAFAALALPIHVSSSGTDRRSCRHGTSMAYLSDHLDPAGWLNLDWFLTFDMGGRYLPAHGELVRMIRFKPEYDAAGQRTGRYFHAWALTDDNGTDNGIPNEYQFYPDFNEPDFIKTVEENPGIVWVIGNEMATANVQDSLMPETYARAYHDAYNGIKLIDPTAQIAVGAILQVSPGRLQYLDLVLAHYQTLYGEPLPADIWTFHAYTLPEAMYYDRSVDASAKIPLGTDPALARLSPNRSAGKIDASLCGSDQVNCLAEHDSLESFQTQVLRMRAWMRDNGYRDRPLMLTEWGILLDGNTTDEYGNSFSYARAASYLDETLSYLSTASDTELGYPADGNRLVQRWSWYNAYVPDLNTLGGPSSLIYPDGRLTPVGEVYWQYTQAGPQLGEDLVIDTVYSHAIVQDQVGETRAEITVRLNNRGDERTQAPIDVILTDQFGRELGRQTVPAGVQGCGTGYHYASVELGGLSAGSYQLLAKLDDSGSGVSDPLPGSDTRTGNLFVGSYGLYMPLIQD